MTKQATRQTGTIVRRKLHLKLAPELSSGWIHSYSIVNHLTLESAYKGLLDDGKTLLKVLFNR